METTSGEETIKVLRRLIRLCGKNIPAFDPGAIECFLLVAFLAYNIFHVFLARNVKPAVRQGKADIFWAKLIAAELYSEVVPAGMSP